MGVVRLVGQQNHPRRCGEDIDLGSQFGVVGVIERRIHQNNDQDLAVMEDTKMTRLIGRLRQLHHHWMSFLTSIRAGWCRLAIEKSFREREYSSVSGLLRMQPRFSKTLIILKISFKERPSPLAMSTLLSPSGKSARNSRISDPFFSAGALYFLREGLCLLVLIKFLLLIISGARCRRVWLPSTSSCLTSEVSGLNHDFSDLISCQIKSFFCTTFPHDG